MAESEAKGRVYTDESGTVYFVRQSTEPFADRRNAAPDDAQERYEELLVETKGDRSAALELLNLENEEKINIALGVSEDEEPSSMAAALIGAVLLYWWLL